MICKMSVMIDFRYEIHSISLALLNKVILLSGVVEDSTLCVPIRSVAMH